MQDSKLSIKLSLHEINAWNQLIEIVRNSANVMNSSVTPMPLFSEMVAKFCGWKKLVIFPCSVSRFVRFQLFFLFVFPYGILICKQVNQTWHSSFMNKRFVNLCDFFFLSITLSLMCWVGSKILSSEWTCCFSGRECDSGPKVIALL